MSTAVRVHSLALSGPGPKTLSSMEAHGKRLDGSGRLRRVSRTVPLVHGTLDLARAFEGHTGGCRMNRAARRPAMHAIVQFPTAIALPDGPAAAGPVQRRMLEAAVEFINRTYGEPGLPAVFAARMDRDEDGRHAVDVFFAPKYWKETKSRGRELWTATTRHGKALCHKHRPEIERRHGGAFSTGPRQIGIALQSEWRAHFAELAPEFGLDPAAVAPKHEKRHGGPDRLEPEAFKARRDLERLEAETAELEAAASQARHDADIAAARRKRSRRLELEQRIADLRAEREGLPFRRQVKRMELDGEIAGLEAELEPLLASEAETDALAAELTREDRDEKAGNKARAAELDAREKGLKAEAVRLGNEQAAAWGAVFGAAAALIADEIVAPEPSPGKWRPAARHSEDRWEAARRRWRGLEYGSWPGRMWESLRRMAALIAVPLRELAAARKEIAELELRPSAEDHAALTEQRDELRSEISKLKRELRPKPDPGPSPSPF